MCGFDSPRVRLAVDPIGPAMHFRQPDNCPVAGCSAIAMYEQELQRHQATEIRLRESALRESELSRQKDELIQQQDILRKESEHRFLNGLQLVTSLLAAQSRATESPEAAAQLTTAANRVATLGRIHRHLHTLDKLETVELKQYLEKLCRDLTDLASGEFPERALHVEGSEINVPCATAIPLGFIATELIINAFKYAKGQITVGLHETSDGACALTVSDDGPGLPATFDPKAKHGLGMKIIAALVRQVHGTLTFAKGEYDQGTRVSVLFNPQVPGSSTATPRD